MRLQQFRINHFKSLYDTNWIPLAELTIFTGENDGGKSSTLSALECFLDPRCAPSLDVFSNRPKSEQEIVLAGKFALTQAESEFLAATWDIETTEIEVFKTYESDGTRTEYLMLVEVVDDPFFEKHIDDYTKAQLQEAIEKFSIPAIRPLNLKQDYVDSVRSWHKDQPKKPRPVSLPNILVEALPLFELFSSETALDPESEINRILAAQFAQLIKADNYSGRISEITKEIEGELNEQLALLTPFVKHYSKDVDSVAIRPTFNFTRGLMGTEIQLRQVDGKPILLNQSGAGQKRRLSLAVYEWSQQLFKNRDKDSRQLVLAFDEPDTHLDYKGQRQIFDVIRRFAGLPALQVIVCTHSLNLIERVPINQIVHFKLEMPSRVSSLEMLTAHDHETVDLFMFEISSNLGLRNSVMLHERCFLITEGSTEFTALPIIFHKLYELQLQSAGICLINGQNNYGARMLVKFLSNNNRNVIFLVDTDATATDSTKKHFTPKSFADDGVDEQSQVFYIGKVEFEDAFSDELWARVAETCYPKPVGNWTALEFSNLRTKTKFSSALQQLIKDEARLEYVPSKNELGYRLAELITPDEIPDVVKKCLTEATRLGN